MNTECSIKKQEGQNQVARVERTRDRWTYTPSVDIVEQAEELLLVADVPGVKADDIDIQYEQGLLTIHAKADPRQDESKTEYLLREYGVGDYYRTFTIGEGIDAEGIHAELKHGVMTLHLPKAESVKPRRIAVKSE